MSPPSQSEKAEKIVTVFGSSESGPGTRRYADAYELGRALGQAGFTLCNGGYGGTMEASAKGAKDAAASTIGVTCRLFARSGPNRYIDRVHEAADLFSRLTLLIDLGRAYIVLPGGSGTLVELALVWELSAKRLMAPRPIILYGEFWKPVIETAALDRPHTAALISLAHSPQAVLACLKDL